MVRNINPAELQPNAVGLLYLLYAALPNVRPNGARLCTLSDVRAYLLQLAFAADPDGRMIPLEVWGVTKDGHADRPASALAAVGSR